MPTVAITSPQTGDPFGPGFLLTATSTFTGPLESGTFWEITLTAPAGEDVLLVMNVPTSIPALSTVVVQGSIAAPQVVEGRPTWVTGAAGRVQVELVQPTLGSVGTDTVEIILDRQAGQNKELQLWIQQNTAAAGQGLTVAEHNAVLQTNVGVIAMATLNPIDLVGDLANAFLTNPPLTFGSLSTTYTLTGDGEMPDIGDTLHTKLGIYFIASIPAGLSHRHGQSEEYPARLIQWRTVHHVAGLDMVTEVVDFDTHGELWKWRVQKPSRIEYSVLPGVVVTARWWQWP